MADIRLDEASPGFREERHSSQSPSHVEGPGEADEAADREIGTACYLCYGQCVNLGVQGAKGRPCARGFSEIIDRRRRARSGAKGDRRSDG